MIHQSQNGSTSSLPSYRGGCSPRKRASDRDLYGGFLDDDSDSDDEGEIRVPLENLSVNQFFICDKYEVDKRTGVVKGSQGRVALLLKDVPKAKFSEQTRFYGCVGCGKVFWEGSHWDRMLGKR